MLKTKYCPCSCLFVCLSMHLRPKVLEKEPHALKIKDTHSPDPNLGAAYPNMDKTKASVINAGATRTGAILVKTISDRSFIVVVSSLHVIQQCFTEQCLPSRCLRCWHCVCVCVCQGAKVMRAFPFLGGFLI